LNHLLTHVTTWLTSLGPAAYLVTMLVPVAGYLVYRLLRKTPPPVVPTPPASAATTPIALAGSQQLLSVLATAMGWSTNGNATTADVPAPMLAKLSQEVAQTTKAKIDGHVAALSDLGSPVVPAPVKS
jgi:hypothetical protein